MLHVVIPEHVGVGDLKSIVFGAEPAILVAEGLPELGWVLATRVHGKGYATEAVRAAIAWGDANIRSSGSGLGRTVCIIHPEHARSIRVAEKCG